MGDWPALGGERHLGSTTVVVTSSATANVKGAWTELVPDTLFGADHLHLVAWPSSNGRQMLFDFAVGPAGSEVVVVPDLHLCGQAGLNQPTVLPMPIPAGSRIAARAAGAVGSSGARLRASVSGGGFGTRPAVAAARMHAYGADASDSGGTAVDPGGTANTFGPWVQMTAATEAPHRGLLLAVGTRANTGIAQVTLLAEIGVGAAGQEQGFLTVELFAISLVTGTGAVSPGWSPTTFPVSLPQGTRLSIRVAATITDATDRVMDYVLYGLG